MTVIIRPIKHSFSVLGCPASAQSSPKTKNQYKMLVAKAASTNVGKPAERSQKVKIEIDWFSEGFSNKPDADNIIKPIQDALKGIVYDDDNQVESVTSRKHDCNSVVTFTREPLCIVEPLVKGHPEYIFVRIY